MPHFGQEASHSVPGVRYRFLVRRPSGTFEKAGLRPTGTISLTVRACRTGGTP